jgi:hypothetical protein
MLYVYAIVAVEPNRDAPPLLSQGLIGNPIWRIGVAEMDAVVSAVAADIFDSAVLRQRFQDVAWTRERIIEHQRVVDSLLADHTVLPLKFCTLFSDRDHLVHAMTRHHRSLKAAVEDIRGALEWGVKMFCDRVRLRTWIESVPAKKPPPAPIPPTTAGAAFFQRKRQDRCLAQEVETTLRAAAEDSHLRLSGIARAAAANPLHATAAHGRADEMVLNGAYLIARDAEERLSAVLRDLSEFYGPRGFTYQQTGPWACYNFTRLTLDDPTDQHQAAQRRSAS